METSSTKPLLHAMGRRMVISLFMKRVSGGIGRERGANTKYSRREQKLQVARYHSGAHLFYMCTTTISFVIIRSIPEEYLDLICCLPRIFKDLEPFKHAFY